MRRRACAIAAALLISDKQIEDLHAVIQEKSRSRDSAQAWAFLISTLVLLRVASEVIKDARVDRIELDDLHKRERAIYRRMQTTTSKAPLLAKDFAREPRPKKRQVGRKDETALRDLVLQIIVQLCPDGVPSELRWDLATTLAMPLWGKKLDVDALRRDIRRRRERQSDSREFRYFVVQYQRRLTQVLSSTE